MACSLRLYVYREYLPLTEDILKLGARIFAVPGGEPPAPTSVRSTPAAEPLPRRPPYSRRDGASLGSAASAGSECLVPRARVLLHQLLHEDSAGAQCTLRCKPRANRCLLLLSFSACAARLSQEMCPSTST